MSVEEPDCGLVQSTIYNKRAENLIEIIILTQMTNHFRRERKRTQDGKYKEHVFLSIVKEGVDLTTMRHRPMRDFILLVLMRGEPVDSHPGAILQGDELLTLEHGDFRAEAVGSLGPIELEGVVVVHVSYYASIKQKSI